MLFDPPGCSSIKLDRSYTFWSIITQMSSVVLCWATSFEENDSWGSGEVIPY